MFLDYFALGILFFVIVVIFYGVIAIHDIPYEIAKKRNHPQQDALHIAGWVSLFTLHAIWPFLWIWATLYREDRGWGFSTVMKREEALEDDVKALRETVLALQTKLERLESTAAPAVVNHQAAMTAEASVTEVSQKAEV
ncbi:conserved hypothetical protein [Shewanella sp. MR-4]|uniref:DUF3302 domain-containing protein n=1 Tax=Shewanella sp. (strain MR-4) TaxID=60480 RepID=UPI00005E5C4E|nr:DUF3302 domain-containing protein [Shewanella sp. MR-4]ABI40088.1 conserved hypothetical protein [Shewanella sp. MR-4]